MFLNSSVVEYCNVRKIKPFPAYTKYAADDFGNMGAVLWTLSELKTVWRKEKCFTVSEQLHFLPNCFEMPPAVNASKMRIHMGKGKQ